MRRTPRCQDAVDPPHSCATDGQWYVMELASTPEADDHLLCLVSVKDVRAASWCKLLYFFLSSFSSLLPITPTAVASSANLTMWLLLYLAVRSWKSRVNRRGLRTWGGPVLTEMVLEGGCRGPLLSVWQKVLSESTNTVEWQKLN